MRVFLSILLEQKYFSILSKDKKAFSFGQRILLIDFVLLNKSLPIPTLVLIDFIFI